ncbi:hypothetical protein [Ferrovibrio terrae]|uniref:hypothetical protein n=1 Tax=Ferrovibrio terrae TaxID=2594003 RepID=UPI0031377F9C
MHLIYRLSILAALLPVLPAVAQTPAQTQMPVQAAPQAMPPAQTTPDAEAKPKAAPKPAAKSSTAPPRNQTMAFTLPDLVPIAEIPRGRSVMIQGVVLSPQASTFVLNDGNSSQVITIGPTWRDLTKVKAGDRVRVIGQMDPYGTPVFRAGSVLLENNRIVVVPPAS